MNIAVVPMRGGSKRIKDKNIKDFCGKPLFYWTILKLKKLKELQILDYIIVSSDRSGYLELVKQYFKFPGLAFSTRPSEYASDKATTEEAVLYELNNRQFKSGTVLIVEVTSPLIPITELNELLMFKARDDAPFTSSFLVSPDVSQKWAKHDDAISHIAGQYRALYKNRIKSQEDNSTYKEIGAWATDIPEFYLRQNRILHPWHVIEVPAEFGISINTEYDFICAETIFESTKNKILKDINY